MSHVDADADYAYHELAHHVVLFRRLPGKLSDWKSVVTTVDLFSMGRAQVHEMRVLALQFVTYDRLGWRPDLKRLVYMSWGGIQDVDNRNEGGRRIVLTEAEARVYIRSLVSKVSQRNVRMYTRAVRAMRGETLTRTAGFHGTVD